MNTETFITRLSQLNDNDWQEILAGQALIMEDDIALKTGSTESATVIFPVIGESVDQETFPDTKAIQSYFLEHADKLLEEYYRTHPLTQKGFNSQVIALLEQLGNHAFVALPGHYPDYSLFVDSGTVIAEARGNPRHPYGAYLELERPLADAALKVRVKNWLENEEAYERYLSMNTCRYSC